MPTKLLLPQAFSVLSEAKEEDDRKRQALLSFYAQDQDLLSKMDHQMLTLLQEHIKNLNGKMKWHEKQLKQTKYFLLVAGIFLKMFFKPSSLIDFISSDDFSFPACLQPYTTSEDSPMRTKVIHYDQLSVNKKAIRFWC